MSYNPAQQQTVGQTGPPVGQAGTSVIIIQQPAPSNKYLSDSIKARTCAFGIIQIICGVLEIFLAIGWYILRNRENSGDLTGAWGGIIFIFAGAFAIHASRTQTKCPTITSHVLSIISSVIAAIGLIIYMAAVWGLETLKAICETYSTWENYQDHCFTTYDRLATIVGIGIFIYIIELIASICQASFFCCANNHGGVGTTNNQQPVPIQGQPYVVYQGQQQQPNPYVNSGFNAQPSKDPTAPPPYGVYPQQSN